MYSQGVTDENYLRGVQETDADGQGHASPASSRPATRAAGPTSTSRSTRSLASATAAGNKIATSQIALPKDACDAVYATSGYGASARNLTQVSLERDMVFRDGWTEELGTVSGTVASGLTVALNAPVRERKVPFLAADRTVRL